MLKWHPLCHIVGCYSVFLEQNHCFLQIWLFLLEETWMKINSFLNINLVVSSYKMQVLKYFSLDFVTYCVMLIWCMTALIWKRNCKVNIKILMIKLKPFKNNMTKHWTLHELICQYRWSFCETIWLKYNVLTRTNISESETSNVILAVSHN